jgi:hypothetical protein
VATKIDHAVDDTIVPSDSMRGNAGPKSPKEKSTLGSALLALVPLGVALVFGPLILPRSAAPDAVPLPLVDARGLDRRIRADHDLAESARTTGLPDDVRLLGTAIRAFHTLEARDAEAADLIAARRAVDDAMKAALKVQGLAAIVRLRAVQLESFLSEVKKFEASGEESPELAAVGGAFVRRMRRDGLCHEHSLLFGETELRILFKLMFDGFLGLDAHAEMTPTVDEMRALYAFYLSHPHLGEAQREAIAAARRGAKDKRACAALDEGERYALETWRLDRMTKLASIDPEYPIAYARGVVLYRRGTYSLAAEAFRDWLRDHPSGPWTTRAENQLRAAVAADVGAR